MRDNIILWLLAVILIMAIFSSCSPSKRIARICKNHPEVCKTDTFYKTIEAEVFTDTIYQDSIITLVLNECDSILKSRGDTNKIDLKTKKRIKTIIKPQIPVYRCLNDTVSYTFPNGTVKLWQEGDKIKCSLLNIQPKIIVPEKEWYDIGFSGFAIAGLALFSFGWIIGKK